MNLNFPVIIVGVGSIGQRHVELLTELGGQVTTVSRRSGIGDVDTVAEAVLQNPEALLVIANETSQHMATLDEADQAGHCGPVAIEKPLCRMAAEIPDPSSRSTPLWVTYNMRYLPVVRALRDFLADLKEPALSVQMSVGQYLGDWRPGRNVDDSYSAHAAAGGGVLRDLSHELDLVVWLWGRPKRVCAMGGRMGSITVDSDDCWNILMEAPSGMSISLGLNYFERPARRFINVVTQSTTINVDLIKNTMSVNGETKFYPAERNTNYKSMWQDILTACEDGSTPDACSIEDAIATVSLIDDCEISALKKVWVSQ